VRGHDSAHPRGTHSSRRRSPIHTYWRSTCPLRLSRNARRDRLRPPGRFQPTTATLTIRALVLGGYIICHVQTNATRLSGFPHTPQMRLRQTISPKVSASIASQSFIVSMASASVLHGVVSLTMQSAKCCVSLKFGPPVG